MNPSVPKISALAKNRIRIPFNSTLEKVIPLGNHNVWLYFGNQHWLTFSSLTGKIVNTMKLAYEGFRACILSDKDVAIYGYEESKLFMLNALDGSNAPFASSRLPTLGVCSESDFGNEVARRGFAATSEMVGLSKTGHVVLRETKDIQSSTPTIVLTAFSKEKGVLAHTYEIKASQPCVFLSPVNDSDSVVAFVQDVSADGTLNFFYWNVISNVKRHVTVGGFSKEAIITDLVQWSNKDLIAFGNPGEEEFPFFRVIPMDKALSESTEEVQVATAPVRLLDFGKEFMLEEILNANGDRSQVLLHATGENGSSAVKLVIEEAGLRVDSVREFQANHVRPSKDGKYFVMINEASENIYLGETSYLEYETGLVSNRILSYWLMKEAKLHETYNKGILKEIIEFLDETK